jgi:hypothetical protein
VLFLYFDLIIAILNYVEFLSVFKISDEVSEPLLEKHFFTTNKIKIFTKTLLKIFLLFFILVINYYLIMYGFFPQFYILWHIIEISKFQLCVN